MDVSKQGSVDNGCAILADIMNDPSAGEKAKDIILNAKKDNLWADFDGDFRSGKYYITVAGARSVNVDIAIYPPGSM